MSATDPEGAKPEEGDGATSVVDQDLEEEERRELEAAEREVIPDQEEEEDLGHRIQEIETEDIEDSIKNLKKKRLSTLDSMRKQRNMEIEQDAVSDPPFFPLLFSLSLFAHAAERGRSEKPHRHLSEDVELPRAEREREESLTSLKTGCEQERSAQLFAATNRDLQTLSAIWFRL